MADVNFLIREAAEKIGFDAQTAKDLHSDLCRCDSHAAAYAAMAVQRALKLYVEADAVMRELGCLANEVKTSE
jgi:hypothetical protein